MNSTHGMSATHPSNQQRPEHQRPVTRILLLIAVAAMLTSVAATAQMPGTIFGLIEDENGNPVPGAKITITDKERPSFEQTEETNKRGRYRILLRNATVRYVFKITAPGHQSVTIGGVKIAARQETRRNFTLTTNAGAQAAAATAGATAAPTDVETGGGANKLYQQGRAAFQSGDTVTAIELFTSALEKKADLSEAQHALALAYSKNGSHDKALEAADKALAMDVDEGMLHQVYYAAHSALGNKSKAEEFLKKMRDADPEKASLNMFNEAVDLYNGGDMAKAKSAFEGVLSANPEHPKANFMIGMIFAAEQDNANAKKHFEKFLALAPTDPDAETAKQMLQYVNG